MMTSGSKQRDDHTGKQRRYPPQRDTVRESARSNPISLVLHFACHGVHRALAMAAPSLSLRPHKSESTRERCSVPSWVTLDCTTKPHKGTPKTLFDYS